MRFFAWAGAAALLLSACVGTSPTLPMTQCDGDQTANQFCNGACTNTQGDPRNCGGCGKSCNTQAGEVCQKGTCGPSCTGGTTRCGTSCLDVQNDPLNCGDCGKKCAGAESCVMGKCTLVCQPGLTICPRGPMPEGGMPEGGMPEGGGPPSTNACVDTKTDPLNCGMCGQACTADKTCDNGTCKLYKFSGIVNNLNEDDLASQWKECFVETYATSGTPIATVLTQKCTQPNLLMGCRNTNTKVLLTAAQGPRADVTFDTGTGQYAFHLANGVAWYFNNNWSWGFFSPLDSVLRSSCDVATGMFPDLRMCWHTQSSQLQTGYRCGSNQNLNNSAAAERVILQAP